MGFGLGFGEILIIAVVVYAGYTICSWLFGANPAAAPSPAPPATPAQSAAPTWLTPVVLVGLLVVGLNARMQTWLVVFGSVFAVVMLVKHNVLSFGRPSAPAPVTPPPLPRDPQLLNATYHPSLTPPQLAGRRDRSKFAAVLATLLVVGGLVLGIAGLGEANRHDGPRNLKMVVAKSWQGVQDGVQEARVEIHQEMKAFEQEMKANAQEMARAAKAMTHPQRVPPPLPAPAASPQPATPPAGPRVFVSPAIPPTEPGRIDEVLGRNKKGAKAVAQGGAKPKKEPKRPPEPPPEPAVKIEHTRSATDLANLPTDESPNGYYIVLTDPNDPSDDYLAAYERAMVLMKNHLIAKHAGVDFNAFNFPSFAWCEANGLIHKRHVPDEKTRKNVLALGTNFSPRAMDLAYNYHLGCERTREAAKGYFGGLLVLGGLGLLLRIGTGVQPSAPLPKV